MNFPDWMDATNAKAKGVDMKEGLRRHELRQRVIKRAGTTSGTLRVAKSTGRLGIGLLQRLEDATEGEAEQITVVEELARQKAARPAC